MNSAITKGLSVDAAADLGRELGEKGRSILDAALAESGNVVHFGYEEEMLECLMLRFAVKKNVELKMWEGRREQKGNERSLLRSFKISLLGNPFWEE